MPEKDNEKTYIKKYIGFYAQPQVAERGNTLFYAQAVLFEFYEEKTDTYHFKVKGSSLYKTTIRGLTNQAVVTSCSCPYDWGSICKHTVAALLFLAENKSNMLVNQPDKPLGRELAYRIGREACYTFDDFQRISEMWIQKHCETRIFNQLRYLFYRNGIARVTFKPNQVRFDLLDSQKSYALFEYENGTVFASSNDDTKTSGLRQYEAYCLMQIAKSPHPDFFKLVFSSSLDHYKMEVIKNFGLTEPADFDNYFKIDFTAAQGLSASFKKESVGLIPVMDEGKNIITNFLQEKQKALPINKTLFYKKESRTLGFVLSNSFRHVFDADNYYDENQEQTASVDEVNGADRNYYDVIPLIGKTNKAGNMLVSHLEEFNPGISHAYEITSSENAQALLQLINEQKGLHIPDEMLQLKKRMLPYLIHEPHIFVQMDDYYQIKKSNLKKTGFSAHPIDIQFVIRENEKLIQAECQLVVGDKILGFDSWDRNFSDFHFIMIADTFHLVKNSLTSEYLYQLPPVLSMAKSFKKEFLSRVIIPLSKHFHVEFDPQTYNAEIIELDFHKKQIYLTEQNDYMLIKPFVVYDYGVDSPLYHAGDIIRENAEKLTIYKRNLELEEDFASQLAEMHPAFQNQKDNRVFYLPYSEFARNLWFYKFFDQLQADHIEVFGLKELKNFKYSPYKGKIVTAINSGQDWFELNLHVSFGDNKVSLSDIKKAVVNKQRYIQLKDGSVGILPSDWFHKLEKYFRNGEIKKDKLLISKLRFSIIDELFEDMDQSAIAEELHQKKKRLESFTEINNTSIPTEMTAQLRNYQKEGVNWLNFLDSMQWGGILADDMGLGKTLQILTFIQQMVNQQYTTQLIVVPTTLLFNWENELRKFAPKLKAFYHYGPDRNQDTVKFSGYHIVFTTYGILLRDIEFLKNFKFNYVFLDESQAIKNPASRRYKAANLLQANNRIALTGTPIENSTFDLYAQMNFVNRGLFGSTQMFKENYSNPIDKQSNEIIASELHRLTHPFILRRTKENVAKELPPKTEDIIYCEMEPEQRKIYDAYRNSYKNKLLKKIEGEGIEKSKLMILEALTRLRQICDSPALLNDESITEKQAVKVKEIMRHITNKTANHKILVFSQFVKMLGIVKSELIKNNIPYEYLDGSCSTKQREQAVNNFQENDALRVFLISLKAGGTGLNLTAADYVYLLDPWWNPAVENQAIDRCYRIGQEKKVFAYRMICKNTVEEKILTLQNKKLKIATDIIQTDKNIMKTISADDLKELLS